MSYLPNRREWTVDDGSEVIQFTGCEYDGEILEVGRFYFQTTALIGDSIWPKRHEFQVWADNVFRTAKRLLKRSKTLDAYVGEHAARWREGGGQFASYIGNRTGVVLAEGN